ncbi:MAG: tyrosine-protein phosphatase [Chloroherpetonaceae bacterium]|nr:tyrosine-protein phosphatase [Chthonomonadaceae bacterium]MDW8206971.1 tyrosine-protein phosphatase [Chloroherpetonaceae bacterium]
MTAENAFEAIQEENQTTASASRAPVSRRVRRVLVVGLLPVVLLLLFLQYIGVFGGNVRTVVPGRVYRSAQLTGTHLETLLDTRGIRTVINLRGASPDAMWYRSEQASCRARGITHIDVALSAVRLPPPEELRKLLHAFDTATYPVLFHCRGGADRSGLTGALYLHIYERVPLEQALTSQLTWRYGHLSGRIGGFAYGQAYAMDDFFALYRRYNAGLPLREWILTRYPAIYAQQPAALRSPGDDEAPRPSSRQLAPAGAR